MPPNAVSVTVLVLIVIGLLYKAYSNGCRHVYTLLPRFKPYPGGGASAPISTIIAAVACTGEVMFGTDSHTCNAGAFGQFASGIGNTDAGFILGTGKLLIKVPPSIRFVLDGEMPPYLLAKDLILQIIGEITVAGSCHQCFGVTAIRTATKCFCTVP